MDPIILPSDPTPLTTAQLLREIQSLEKLMDQRIDAIEKAVEVAHENLVRVPTEVDKAVGHLRDVVMQKFETTEVRFSGIKTQISERDIRVDQAAHETKVAVDAALAAQEKGANKQTETFIMSIAKSEAAIAKQMDQQSQLLVTTTHGLSDKIDDIKDRITRIEGEGRGLKEAETTQKTATMNTVSVIGLVLGTLIGVAGVVIAVVTMMVP
jgi:hypothetical protein